MSQSSRQDRPAVERAVTELIRALGLDARVDPELDRTPGRIAEFYAECFSGMDPEGSPDLAIFPYSVPAGSPESPRTLARLHEDLVVVRDLEFHSTCIHHFAPFFGRATIAYVPGDRIVGISGPARLLDWYSHRPQLQERITTQIADHLERLLAPQGVAVLLKARHLCMEMRGIRKRGMVETSTMRGALAGAAGAVALGLSRG